MKSRLEVECVVKGIEKENNAYFVKSLTEGNRDLSFQITGGGEGLHFEKIILLIGCDIKKKY